MRQLSYLSGLDGLDDGVADCDGSCDLRDEGPPCLLHSGLCCPIGPLDDETDTVAIAIDNDKELLQDLAVAASLPPATAAPGRVAASPLSSGNSPSSSAAETTTTLPPTPWRFVVPRRKRRKRRDRRPVVMRGSIRPGIPTLHAAAMSSSSSSSSGNRPCSLAAETSSPPQLWRLVVPTRKRSRRSVVMRDSIRRPCSLGTPAIPTPHVAGNSNPSSSSGGSGGGSTGARRQLESLQVRPRPPPTNRQRVQRVCSNCGSTETPLWRTGSDGSATLCNKCGLRLSRNRQAAQAS